MSPWMSSMLRGIRFIDLTESIGAVPVRKARIDLDRDGSLRLMEFIKSAIANSNQEQDTWWN